MRIVRIAARIVVTLIGLWLLFSSLALGIGTSQSYEGWWVILSLGLPLAALFLAIAWALWTGHRVRPVAGIWMAVAALVYAALFARVTIMVTEAAQRSANAFAAMGFIVPVLLWPLPVLFTLIAGILLWKQGAALGRLLFTGIALGWLTAWIGFWMIMWPIWPRPEQMPPMIDRMPGLVPPAQRPGIDLIRLLIDPESWMIHMLFLLPTLLAAGMGWMAGRGGARR